MFSWLSSLFSPSKYSLSLYNTLSKKKEMFSAVRMGAVRVYCCGPTVYGPQHIGNLSKAVFDDLLRRVLIFHEYTVKQVINITDFGHLSGDNDGDADQGEDRMTKGLRREGLELTMENMMKLARTYEDQYKTDLKKLNVGIADITFPRASDYVHGQIAMIQALQEKGYAYVLPSGVYFDTARFPTYGCLGGRNEVEQEAGVRVSIEGKHNPEDFVLWKSDGKIGWQSPWGLGFPGWHIECSAMARSCLGEQIDIHTGGIEHISIHHNNEIAQSECATGKNPFSRFWMHREHIKVDGGKMAKSQGTAILLSDLEARGVHPLLFRYWLMTSHYRTPANFTYEAVEASGKAYHKLRAWYKKVHTSSIVNSSSVSRYRTAFIRAVSDDLNTPTALAALFDAQKDDRLSADKAHALLALANTVLGLGLETPDEEFKKENPHREKAETLLAERLAARAEKNWTRSDELRGEIEKLGFTIKDGMHESELVEK